MTNDSRLRSCVGWWAFFLASGCSDGSPAPLEQKGGASGADMSGLGGATTSASGAGGIRPDPSSAGTMTVGGASASMAGRSGDGGAAGGAAAGSAAAGTGGTSPDPVDKIVLFDGNDLSQWQTSKNDDGDPAPWIVNDAAFEVVPGSGEIETRQAFGDFKLHVEFWIPLTPMTNVEQDRGNSGLYLQRRYELQVLDSWQHPLEGQDDCGAFYQIANASSNESLPPETWQTYDITFQAARYTGSEKTAMRE